MSYILRFTFILSSLFLITFPTNICTAFAITQEAETDNVPKEMSPVNFYFPKNVYHFKVKEEMKKYYEALYKFLKENKDMKIYLTGFAYDGSKKDWNDRLSKYRANKVRDSLVDAGFNNNQIVIDSKGKSDPLAQDDSEKEIAKNRRVELRVK